MQILTSKASLIDIVFSIRFDETQHHTALGAQRGNPSMCDYSLRHLASRPAKVGEGLVTTRFKHSVTGGFCSIGQPNVAVCLMPGTEVAFEREIERRAPFWMRRKKLGSKVARFRHVNPDCPTKHHDALELPS